MSISALSTGDLSYWEQLAAAALNKTGNSGEKILSDFVLADGNGAEAAKETTAAASDAVADKSVSREELEAALQLAANLARLQLGLNQKEDQPGAEGLTAASASAAGAAPSGGQQVFDSLDTNQDGVVSNEELTAFLKTSQDKGEQAGSGRAVTKLQAAISAYNAQTLTGVGGFDLAA